jgi:hypothetical protein
VAAAAAAAWDAGSGSCPAAQALPLDIHHLNLPRPTWCCSLSRLTRSVLNSSTAGSGRLRSTSLVRFLNEVTSSSGHSELK